MVKIGSETEEEKITSSDIIKYERAPRHKAPNIAEQQSLVWSFRQAWKTYHKQVNWNPKSPAAKELLRGFKYLEKFPDKDVQDGLADARTFLKARGVI